MYKKFEIKNKVSNFTDLYGQQKLTEYGNQKIRHSELGEQEASLY